MEAAGNENLYNMTADGASAWILERTPSYFQVIGTSWGLCVLTLMQIWFSQRMVATNYSYGIERDEDSLKNNDMDHTKWSNPLEIRSAFLPCAQSTIESSSYHAT